MSTNRKLREQSTRNEPDVSLSSTFGRLAPFFVLLALSGCTSDEPGSAAMASSIASGDRNSVEQPSSTATTSERELDTTQIDPCDFLSLSDLSRFGEYKAPIRQELTGMRGCDFMPQRNGTEGSLPTIGVGIRDQQSVETVNDQGLGVTEATFNGRNAAQIPDQRGGCIIALALTDSSRVDVGVTGVDHEQACELVEQVAEIVEPKLPEQR